MRRLSAEDLSDLWTRWRRGEPLRGIARALGRQPGTIWQVVQPRGGIAPRPRRRAPRTLTRAEREEISRGLAQGEALRAIARRLHRPASTISRDVQRHGGRRAYRAEAAEAQAWRAARRPKRCRLATRPRLRRLVAHKLASNWSPQQIAGWLRVTYADDPTMQVSHETIYRSLFIQSRGVLKATLRAHLRRRTTMRRGRQATRRGHRHGQIVDAVSIRERPAAIEDRAVPGHWEGDLLTGGNDTHIATLIERHSRFTMLVKLPRKDTTTVVAALAKHVRKLPEELRRSLTWDQGKEMHAHKRFTVATNVRVYFCDPRSPWQRGSNENTNGLLRQYFPRATNLSHVSQAQLNAVALRLNQRPRKILDFETPADRLQKVL